MADVLAGAREVFFRCGYEGASVDAIAAEGKVSKATMYSYYPSKEQLFLGVVEFECGRLAEEILRPLTTASEPRAQLEELALRIVDLTLDDTYIRLLRTCIGASEALPEVGEVYFRAGPKPARELVGRILERLTREGALDVDDNIRATLAAENGGRAQKSESLANQLIFWTFEDGQIDDSRAPLRVDNAEAWKAERHDSIEAVTGGGQVVISRDQRILNLPGVK